MASRNEQDYLRTIYELQSKKGRGVRTSEIAGKLEISLPSVTEMIGKLQASGLVERKPYGSVSLTEKGTGEARKVLRRHRLLEVFFAKLLKLRRTFHREAHELEHAISQEAEIKLEKLLGNPKRCPDDDEIPARNARVVSLCNAPPGKPLRVLFTKLERKEELTRVKALGIVKDEKVRILERVSNGPLVLLVKGSRIALGKEVCSSIYVEFRE
ncbi:MAG: metal-dependent transcriptional regulator [Candidatus Micrarchaeota archaeon]